MSASILISKEFLSSYQTETKQRGKNWLEAGEDCTVRSFITSALEQILLWC